MTHQHLSTRVLLLLILCSMNVADCSTIPALFGLTGSCDTPEKSSGFYAKVVVREPIFHDSYNARIPLQSYAAADFERLFASYTSKQILGQHTLFMFDEFVLFAKNLPEYAQAISALHKKLSAKGSIAKFLGTCFGIYNKNFATRIAALYQEIEKQKKYENAVKQQQKRAQQEEYAYKNKLTCIAQNRALSDARIAALALTQQQGACRSLRSIDIDAAVGVYAQEFGISQEKLAEGYMNAYEYQLHTEFIEQFAELTYLTDAHQLIPKENLLLDTIGQGVALGIEANKNCDPLMATRLADCAWELLEIAKGVAEGGVLGLYNSACFAKNMVCHPIESAVIFLRGFGALACAVTKIVIWSY